MLRARAHPIRLRRKTSHHTTHSRASLQVTHKSKTISSIFPRQRSLNTQLPITTSGRKQQQRVVLTLRKRSTTAFVSHQRVNSDEFTPKASFSTQPKSSFRLNIGVQSLPLAGKTNPKGEDAYFTLPNALGVADGVGGWSKHGVDPSKYSNALMENCKKVLLKNAAQTDIPASTVLYHGWSATLGVTGSSTACIGTFCPQTQFIDIANLGDSGVAIFREGDLLVATNQQQHSFNFPFQLAGDENQSDSPFAASSFQIRLDPQDILVFGTDGLWDNLFFEEVQSLVRNMLLQGETEPEHMAKTIGHAALLKSRSQKVTPFQVNSMQRWTGGKTDDILTLVATLKLQE